MCFPDKTLKSFKNVLSSETHGLDTYREIIGLLNSFLILKNNAESSKSVIMKDR
jgi:hypothetical protein